MRRRSFDLLAIGNTEASEFNGADLRGYLCKNGGLARSRAGVGLKAQSRQLERLKW